MLRPQTESGAKDARPYDPADDKFLTEDRCFLCGHELTSANRTAEHVFPKWMLNRYGLWDAELTLLNGSSISYRQVKIPCCRICNGIYLSALEHCVESAVSAGYRAFRRLPQGVIFQWLSKIFFQILYLEMRLAINVKKPRSETILSQEFVDQFRLEHLLLNSVRVPVHISKPMPWSIFVVPAQTSSRQEANFDFLDNLHGQVVALRMGDIAIFAALMDGHAQGGMFGAYFSKLARDLKLHPIQFRELAAHVAYKRHTMNRIPKFMTAWHQEGRFVQVVTLPLAGLSSRPIFDDWDQAQYARFLHFYVREMSGLSYDDLFTPPHQVLTFLRKAGNRYNHIDIESHGWQETAKVKSGLPLP